MSSDLETTCLRSDELASRLGISEATLRREVESGALHAPICLGERIKVWRLSWVKEYLDRKEGKEGKE